MKYDIVNLNEHYNVQGGTLKSICIEKPWDSNHDNWNRPALLIIPGGAYRFVSNREGESIAADFLAKGYQTFILTYLVKDDGARCPEQLIEMACAVDYIKKHSAEYGVDVNRVFAVGFSAGGHLVANLSNEYINMKKISKMDLDCSLHAVGLAYPVISISGGNTFENLTDGFDDSKKKEVLKRIDLINIMGKHTTPAYIWTTREDTGVDPLNSYKYALKLAELGIPYEFHLFPYGWHGLSSGKNEVNDHLPKIVPDWEEEMDQFFKKI